MSKFDNARSTLARSEAHLGVGKQQERNTQLTTLARPRVSAGGVLLIAMVASLSLSACGGSAGSSTNAAAASSTPTTISAGPNTRGGGRERFSAIRECLKKNGIKPPKRAPRSTPRTGLEVSLGPAADPPLPKGVTRTQFEAGFEKCGGHGFDRSFGGPNGPKSRTSNPRFRQGLARFAACLRQNGVDLPAPNTSGKGPIFSTKGLKTDGPRFRTAMTKCHSALIGTFRRPGSPAPQS